MQRGLLAIYPTPISTIFETTHVNLCPCDGPVKKSNFLQGFFRPPHAIFGWVGWWVGEVLVRSVQLKRHNFGRRVTFQGLANIPRMCLLYMSF